MTKTEKNGPTLLKHAICHPVLAWSSQYCSLNHSALLQYSCRNCKNCMYNSDNGFQLGRSQDSHHICYNMLSMFPKPILWVSVFDLLLSWFSYFCHQIFESFLARCIITSEFRSSIHCSIFIFCFLLLLRAVFLRFVVFRVVLWGFFRDRNF